MLMFYTIANFCGDVRPYGRTQLMVGIMELYGTIRLGKKFQNFVLGLYI